MAAMKAIIMYSIILIRLIANGVADELADIREDLALLLVVAVA